MLKVFDSRTEKLPTSDYIHTNSLEDFPFVMYSRPDESTEVYTVKGYWSDNTHHTHGMIFIMDDSSLPHQGECLNIFHIEYGKLIHATYHSPPSKHELDIYAKSGFPEFEY